MLLSWERAGVHPNIWSNTKTTLETKKAIELQDRGVIADLDLLQKDGIERFSQEAIPYYACCYLALPLMPDMRPSFFYL